MSSQGRAYPDIPRLQLYNGNTSRGGRRGNKEPSPAPSSPPGGAATSEGGEAASGPSHESRGGVDEMLGMSLRTSGAAASTHNSVTPHISDLPDVVQRTVKGCSRQLEPQEMRILSKLTTEQRCAALGMECEGYSHDVILSYLLPANRKSKPDAKRPAYQPANSRGRSRSPTTSPRNSQAWRGPSPTTSRATSPVSTPRSGTTGTPRGGRRAVSPYHTNTVHQHVADEVKFKRQNSDTTLAQEREKLKARTHYDPRKESQKDAGYLRTSSSPRGRSAATSTSSTPYWARATTPVGTTPRRQDGARVPAPKTFGETAHRSSYLPLGLQLSSHRTKNQQTDLDNLGVKQRTVRKSTMTPYARTASAFVPPPKLSRQQSGAVKENSPEANEKDEISTRKQEEDDDGAPESLSETQRPSSSITNVAAGAKEPVSSSSTSRAAASSVTAVTTEDPLAEVSAFRVKKWMDDFHLRLASLRIATSTWAEMSRSQKVALFQQWRLPELQRRVILSRYPN